MAAGSRSPRIGSDPRNRADCIFPAAPQTVAIGAASAQSTAFSANATVGRFFATSDCLILFGANPTALSTSHFLPAGVVEYFGIVGGQKVAVIQASAAGTPLYFRRRRLMPRGGGIWVNGSSRVQKVTLAHTALQTAGLTNNITLLTLAPNELIKSITMKHSTAFAGGLIASYTLSIGIAGNLTKYLTAKDVFTAVGDTVNYGAIKLP